ncbi:MAG: glycosyltransferase family 39 protein, partial [Patescibacteria group bacterium]
PPLTFIIQNVFFKVFGDSLWSARLPSAVFGSLSVILIYLIANILFGGQFLGLLAALVFSLNNGLIGISRTALMEPVLIFLILANIYSFFRFRENKNWWWVFGLTLGLAFLAKYTAIFLIPIYFIYLILFERKTFFAPLSGARSLSDGRHGAFGGKNWRFYAALLLALLIFSPVLVYNYFLFQATGHFDLQFSYLFGQTTPEWSGLLGKTQDGFGEIIKNLLKTFGLIDLLMFFGGLIYAFFVGKREKSKVFLFIFIYLIVLTLLLVKIGSAARFSALYGPVFVIFSALFIRFLWQFSQEKVGVLFKVIAVIFLVSALSFSIRENILRRDANNFGIAGLDNFLSQEIDKINPAFMPQTDNNHLNAIIEKAAADKNNVGIQQPVLIVYNDNMAITTLQWIVYRRFFYHALPFYYVENFLDAVNKDPQQLRNVLIYFIQSTQNTLLNPFKKDKVVGDIFEKNLVQQGILPIKIIFGNNDLEMFKIYKFTL